MPDRRVDLRTADYKADTLVTVKGKKANTVDPDETAHYEPSHLDLQCLQIQLLLL